MVFVARVSKGLPRNEFFQILKKSFKFLKSFPFWKFCGNSTIVKFGIWKVTGANSSLRANYTSRAGSWSQFLFKREGPSKWDTSVMKLNTGYWSISMDTSKNLIGIAIAIYPCLTYQEHFWLFSNIREQYHDLMIL